MNKTYLQALNEGLRQLLTTMPEAYILGDCSGSIVHRRGSCNPLREEELARVEG